MPVRCGRVAWTWCVMIHRRCPLSSLPQSVLRLPDVKFSDPAVRDVAKRYAFYVYTRRSPSKRKDLTEARLLLSLAASQGNAEAQALLGWIYLVGHKVRVS